MGKTPDRLDSIRFDSHPILPLRVKPHPASTAPACYDRLAIRPADVVAFAAFPFTLCVDGLGMSSCFGSGPADSLRPSRLLCRATQDTRQGEGRDRELLDVFLLLGSQRREAEQGQGARRDGAASPFPPSEPLSYLRPSDARCIPPRFAMHRPGRLVDCFLRAMKTRQGSAMMLVAEYIIPLRD